MDNAGNSVNLVPALSIYPRVGISRICIVERCKILFVSPVCAMSKTEINRIYHRSLIQTEKSQPEGKRIMPETRFTDVSRNKLIPTSMNFCVFFCFFFFLFFFFLFFFFVFFFLKLKGAIISTKNWLASQQRYQLCKTNMLSSFSKTFFLCFCFPVSWEGAVYYNGKPCHGKL